jgi:hypothetical protein
LRLDRQRPDVRSAVHDLIAGEPEVRHLFPAGAGKAGG